MLQRDQVPPDPQTPTNPSIANPPSPSPNPEPAASPGASPPIQSQPARPDYLPESFWDAATNSVKATDLKAVFDAHTATQARLALVPKEATGYEHGLPADFKLPDGYKVDDKHPLVQPWRMLAHQLQLTPDQYKLGVKMWAENMVREEEDFKQFKADQRKALGAQGDARVTAARTWLTGLIGEQIAGQLLDLAVTKPQFEAIEKLMTAFTSQGGSTYRGNGRENGGGQQPPAQPPTLEQKFYGNSPQRTN